MLTSRSRRLGVRTSSAALLLAAGLLVSGCGLLPSPAPSASTPSSPSAPAPTASGSEGTQAEQCARLIAQFTSIATDLGRVGELLGSDPFGALALLGDISGRVGDLQTRVSDPELLERIGEIQAGWNAIMEDARAAITSGDASGIERATAAMTQLGQQVAELEQFCAGTA